MSYSWYHYKPKPSSHTIYCGGVKRYYVNPSKLPSLSETDINPQTKKEKKFHYLIYPTMFWGQNIRRSHLKLYFFLTIYLYLKLLNLNRCKLKKESRWNVDLNTNLSKFGPKLTNVPTEKQVWVFLVTVCLGLIR